MCNGVVAEPSGSVLCFGFSGRSCSSVFAALTGSERSRAEQCGTERHWPEFDLWHDVMTLTFDLEPLYADWWIFIVAPC